MFSLFSLPIVKFLLFSQFLLTVFSLLSLPAFQILMFWVFLLNKSMVSLFSYPCLKYQNVLVVRVQHLFVFNVFEFEFSISLFSLFSLFAFANLLFSMFLLPVLKVSLVFSVVSLFAFSISVFVLFHYSLLRVWCFHCFRCAGSKFYSFH